MPVKIFGVSNLFQIWEKELKSTDIELNVCSSEKTEKRSFEQRILFSLLASQLKFASSKATTETLEKGLKYVQS